MRRAAEYVSAERQGRDFKVAAADPPLFHARLLAGSYAFSRRSFTTSL